MKKEERNAMMNVRTRSGALSSRIAVTLFLLSFFQPLLAGGGSNRTRPVVPAVLVFGDSIVDTGNNNAILTLIKCNFPPYGKDFVDQQPTGRFSNGRIPPDFIGIKEVVPSYLGTDLTPEDILTGVTFASGGTGYDPLTPVLASVLSMSDQLDLFKEYKDKLTEIAGEEKTATIVAESLFIVCAGSDDIANNYFITEVRRLQYDIESYADFIIQQASDFIEQLFQLGARKIAVVGIPPLGCLPSQRILAGEFQKDCDPSRNQAALLFNSKLRKQVQRFHEELGCTKIGYVDIYDIFLDLIQHPQNYGFEESSKGCCGTGNFEVSILCNSLTASTCEDDTKYVFWDSFHPTEKAYEVMVEYLFHTYVEKLL
ncbi:GDSL esterase/lipase EXL3-like isoform X2 [Typha latifolia]|uniref:GDSL esterase/lipase EXL3-like isoform X2 n=1 Tax=Typha latifolia TaxID=4733 RepID=UPI003C2D034E